MSEPIVEALELPYGTIVGDGATVHADGSDANPHPDVSAFEGVRVTFTPSDGTGKRVNTVIWTGADGPTVLHPQVETGRFEGGRLVLDVPTPPQPDGMRLMATVSDDMVPNSWGWKMEWQGWPTGKGPGPVIFPLAPGATVDIAEALAGYLPEVPAVDFANLLAAADEVLAARDDALTARDQTIALRDEVEVISGLTGEDEAVALLVGDPGSATSAAVVAAADARRSRLDGERLLWVGDSITLLGTTLTQGQSYTTFAEWRSGGRVREFARTAVSGNRSDQQLAAVTSLIAAGGTLPTMASILIGTNDLGQGVPVTTWQANVRALVATLRGVGIEPVLCTLPPRSGPASPHPPAVVDGEWNAWLRGYAADNGIVLVDTWAAVADPVTGEWRTGWVNPADGVHPTAVAQKAMGDAWLDAVVPHLLPPPYPQLDGVQSAGDRAVAGAFTEPGPVPAGYNITGSATVDVVVDPTSPTRHALRLVADNPAVRPDILTRIYTSAADFAPGDVLEVVALIRVVEATVAPGFGLRLSVQEYAGATPGVYNGTFCFGQSTPTDKYMTVRYRFAPDAATDQVRVIFQYIKDSTGSDHIEARMASLRIYNVTALGLT